MAETHGNAWWIGSFSELSQTGVDSIVERLSERATKKGIPGTPEQHDAWTKSAQILIDTAVELQAFPGAPDWGVAMEFELPRRAVRPDAVVLAGDVIIPIEFKVGSGRFDRASRIQASGYARDLSDFHEASHGKTVIPVLIATKSPEDDIDLDGDPGDYRVQCARPESLPGLLIEIHDAFAATEEQLAITEWSQSRYKPTLSILQAARDVYAGNEVREFSLSYADNLSGTVDAVREVIRSARESGERRLCLVTGVPGSGKTLAGLSAIHEHSAGTAGQSLGAYLSGNGPLIQVLRYAIASDLRTREGVSKDEADHRASVFIQPVHRFVSELGQSDVAPPENVVVFDEAQRAWSEEMMERKQDIIASEAATTLSIMERAEGWAVIVALVGEGQEINKGEAGIEAWLEAVGGHSSWSLYVPSAMAGLEEEASNPVTVIPELHLDVSVRSPRAKAIASWADSVTKGELQQASEEASLFDGFPVLLTRDLEEMREYLRDVATPDTRVGLVASSQARRLRPFGIEMDANFHGGVSWGRWFVDPQEDIRSSYSLEVAASEFSCQGLELDWVGLCWGSDFTWNSDHQDWKIQKLRGSRWVRDNEETFARNRYRVLLTRARSGMVIWVPKPSHEVPLVDGRALDATAATLISAGCEEL